MKIKYFGHSCFMLTNNAGRKILFDPYQPHGFGGSIAYKPVKESPDIVCISHDHPDHAYIDDLSGSPTIVAADKPRIIHDVAINPIKTYHDRKNGRERGINLMYLLQTDGLKILHCGDIGHKLDSRTHVLIGTVDVLFVPIGGKFTIGPEEAYDVAQKLKAHIVIPMHYKTKHIGFPIQPVGNFLKKFSDQDITEFSKSEIEISPPAFDDPQQVYVLDYVK